MVKAKKTAEWVTNTGGILLIYSSTDLSKVAASQDEYGRDESAKNVGNFFEDVAQVILPTAKQQEYL